jgi:hypothetical protein
MDFEASHVYSTGPKAGRKRMIDEQIMGSDRAKQDIIDMSNEAYLKELIKVSSKNSVTVSSHARGLQFFIIKGGGEGFLDASYGGQDASNEVVGGGATTSGAPGTIMRFDSTDLIAAFDAHGVLISSALLRRPLSIQHPNIWSEHAANAVYDAWDGQPVSIYYNKNPHWDIHYYGLWVNDSRGYYASGRIRVDLHKEEATNGCIFILDPNTPPYSAKLALNNFEPKFIKDIQRSIGAHVKRNIGIMHMVDIK